MAKTIVFLGQELEALDDGTIYEGSFACHVGPVSFHTYEDFDGTGMWDWTIFLGSEKECVSPEEAAAEAEQALRELWVELGKRFTDELADADIRAALERLDAPGGSK